MSEDREYFTDYGGTKWAVTDVPKTTIHALPYAKISGAMQAAHDQMERNLRECLYGDSDAARRALDVKPTPRWKIALRRCRRVAGEKLADFASFVAGYDVREY